MTRNQPVLRIKFVVGVVAVLLGLVWLAGWITGAYIPENSRNAGPFGRVALAVARQGSHRSGRARIRASGSSNQQLYHPRWSPKRFNQVTWRC